MSTPTRTRCDDVFERLTRGPFPQPSRGPDGQPNRTGEDEKIQRHIDSCHDCRQLAEAFRPAIGAMNEALEASELLTLPRYHHVDRPPEPWDSVPPGKSNAAGQAVDSQRRPTVQQRDHRQRPDTLWLVATVLLCVGFGAGLVLLGQKLSPYAPQTPATVAGLAPVSEGNPSREGIKWLQSLGITDACYRDPANARVDLMVSDPMHESEHAAVIGEERLLNCCTECHAASANERKSSPKPSPAAMARRQPTAGLIGQTCFACHFSR